jgi:hypothetical protein
VVDGCEAGEAPDPTRGQMQLDLTMVCGVDSSLHQACLFRPIDETDGTVMTYEEMVGHIPDAGSAARMPTNGKEQLMLGGGDPDLDRLLFAPSQKVSQVVPEGQEALIVGVR